MAGLLDGMPPFAALRAFHAAARRGRIALTLPPSLAVFWLIPNLAGFEQANPDIDLELVTTTRLVDLRREQIDLALRRGRGPWPDVESEFLLAETAVPVCKPGFLGEDATGDVAGVLARSRLIINSYFPDEWLEWAQVNGLPAPDAEGALRLDSQEQVFAAAENGLGLAIGRSPLVDDRLKSGVLIAPFGTPDPSDAGYHLCRPPGATPTAAARRVARWLRALAEAEAAS